MAVYGDIIEEGPHFVEEAGIITEATRVFVVSLSCNGILIGDVLANALREAGIPQPGDPIALSVPNVRVERRVPSLVATNGTTAKVKVEVHYRLQRPTCDYSLRGGATLSQISASKIGTTNVTVRYCPNTSATNSYVTAGDSINIRVPLQRFSREMVEATNNPDAIVMEWINTVNSATWRGGAAEEWMCTNVQYDLVDSYSNPKRYKFIYEFERNPETWVYTLAYHKEDGMIPTNAAATYPPGGLYEYHYHELKDFSRKFP